jgi:predicted phosphodiesterase
VRVGVLADVHGNADALEAVLRAAVDAGVDELWSLGDMVGSGPDAARAVALVRTSCAVALIGNHDRGATGGRSPDTFGPPGSLGRRSLELAAAALAGSDDLAWLRSRRPAARRAGVQCWHGSPRHPVHEYVTAANAGACLERQRSAIGLVGHTHEPAAWRAVPGGRAERLPVAIGEPRELGDGKWLLNPGAVGAPFPVRGGWWESMAAHARAGAWWLELDVDVRVATWRRAPFDPAPVIDRARAAGLAGEPRAPSGGPALR